LSEFTIGQRWISNTEAELGLGIVSVVETRHTTITYPAAGEQRVYASNNAPLTRVLFRVGETIRDNESNTLVIANIIEDDGYLTYTGIDQNSEEVEWGEVEIDCTIQFSKPQDRLFAGQIDKLRDYKLRYQTLQHQHRLSHSSVQGMIGPRVQLLEHQLYIANEVGSRYAPRVLLADEVGLGKTIEAGLIIHQQLINGLSQRVLITVPDSLAHQWLVEMLRRFNLHFTLLDQNRCNALVESGEDNPFESAQLVLCTISLLTENQTRLQQALECDWDLMVVDEAHHLEWHPQQASDAYTCIEQLAQKSLGLLLLTATPEQLGIDGHFARLRLLDPDRYFDLNKFLQEQKNYHPVNDLVQVLLNDSNALVNDQDLQEKLKQLLGTSVEIPIDLTPENLIRTRDKVIDQLLDQHGTGRVLFRNTRAAVKGFPHRHMHSYGLHEDEYFQVDEHQGSETINADNPKVKWLVQWLKQHRQEKVLVICSSADTALDLDMHLNLRAGLRSSSFHEGLSLLERDRAAAYFADEEDGAQVLVCSEIGSEGRNFQFAHNLVMYDLPLNPDLIEQRIGRLDRIGQTSDVQIHLPYYCDSAEETHLQWLHQGLNCFERVCPVGQQIYQQFADELHDLINSHQPDKLSDLIERTRARTDSTLEELQKGRDRLLELNSCKPEKAALLSSALNEFDESSELQAYLDSAFNIYGVDCDKHSENAVVIHPSDHMQTQHFPSLPDEGMTATYSRQHALSREDIHYLTWEHPMARGVMDMVTGSELGNTSLCTIKLPPLKPGSLLVEAIFQFSCPAPKYLQVHRFTESTSLRLLCDSQNKSLGHIITIEHIDNLGEKVKRPMAKQLVHHARTDIEKICLHLESEAQTYEKSLIKVAINNLTDFYSIELNRLHALAKVNPNIRQEEIDYCQTLQTEGLKALQNGQLRLDAIRVIVAT
jgi:ATP-dependent helicase HepA